MPGNELPSTGADATVELLVNGVPVSIVDDVQSFSANAQYQKIERRTLGSYGVKVKNLPDGWAGEIEVDRRNGALDAMVDAYNLAVRNRVPVVINISAAVNYNDGTSRRYTYADVVIDFSTMARRGEAMTSRLSWRSGKERV